MAVLSSLMMATMAVFVGRVDLDKKRAAVLDRAFFESAKASGGLRERAERPCLVILWEWGRRGSRKGKK